jgi:membrane fusion protein (multidrug efflux system)
MRAMRNSRHRWWLAAGVALPVLVAVGFGLRPLLAGRDSGARESAPEADSDNGAASAEAAPSSPATEDGAASAEQSEGVRVGVVTARRGSVSAYVSATANLVAEDEVKVLAEVDGRVTEVTVEEGGRVAKGQVLAVLDRQEAEIALRKAEIRAASARQVYERAIRARADDLLSDEEFEKKKSDMEVADQELEEARWRLDRKTIRAPFAGRVTERAVRVGQHLKPGEALFSVADFEPLVARIYLPEKDILGLAEGREARLTLRARESVRFSGRIRQISPVVDPATGTIKVTIEASSPPAEARPGAFVNVDIVREARPEAVLVPREAVQRELGDAFVYVIIRERVAERREVSLGIEEGGRIEALSGVQAGEQVVVAGQGGLRHGSPVKIVPAS